jgi:hypothetical protein
MGSRADSEVRLTNRCPCPEVYSKDTLGDDFRALRKEVFPTDTRRLMAMRRSGNVEAVIGGAAPVHLAAKLANTLSQSNQIFETYSPVQLAAVRQADKARDVGRRRIKLNTIAPGIKIEQNKSMENKSGNFPTPAPVSGRTMARCGLRMMPPFPSPPLSCRKAGFPRYGWKAGVSGGTFPRRQSA